MKAEKRKFLAIIPAVLALILITVTMGLGWKTLDYCQNLALAYHAHPDLLKSMRNTDLFLLILSSAATVGIGILILLLWFQLRHTARVQREAEVLQRKYDAMASLNQQIRDLAHHQRLELIGTMTSSIAHEFNNLLTPIMGYSMMALETISPEDELYDDLLEIYTASNKAKTIISRLSDLSRKNSSLTFRQISIDTLVQKTLDVALPAKPKNVELRLSLNCWDQHILANEIQINQLLLNLVINAYHAMEASGGILSIATIFDDTNILLQVKDTGCGIPENQLGKIFDPFFTTKEAGKGTGLGLAIVQQVVEDHHGRIEVNSTPGQGTSFTVWLPRFHDAQGPSS